MYNDPNPNPAGKDYWIGLYKGGPDWSWANSRCTEASFTNWAVGQPDAAFGCEECALMSGTGRWEDYGCHLAEVRCLCELGSAAPPAYYESMQVHSDMLDAASWKQRLWIGAVLGAALGLPILLDENVASFGVAPTDSTPVSLVRARLLVGRQVGWALSLLGFGPVFCHYLLGSWDAAQLGSWPSYTPVLVWGPTLMVECMGQNNERMVALFIVAAKLAIAFTSLANVGAFLLRREQLPLYPYERSYLFTWCGFGALSFYSGSSLILELMRNSGSRALYNQIWYQGRLCAGTCGTFLLLVFLAPIVINDPQFAFQHPYGIGTMATTASWLAFSIFGKPGAIRRLISRDPRPGKGGCSFV